MSHLHSLALPARASVHAGASVARKPDRADEAAQRQTAFTCRDGDCFGLGFDTANEHRLLNHQPSQ
ncbi:MAG: hypothetical protein L0Z71_11945 [Anaerolineae bacterium]|nr:hypothetical protein [Anaerolineae bacterium]